MAESFHFEQKMELHMNLAEVGTPALVLDRGKLQMNIDRMNRTLAGSKCNLRPHVKTCKSIDVANLVLSGQKQAITVSTLKEAEYFFEQGILDITYGVAIIPSKLPRVASLIKRGANIHVILDSMEMAREVAAWGKSLGVQFSVLIEIDCDGHRGGLRSEQQVLLQIGRLLGESEGTRLEGVLTHAGESYNCRSRLEIQDLAEQERAAVVEAAMLLRTAEIECYTVSVGSSPTALLGESREGVTEIRAGVYMFQDLFQSNLGVCTVDEIALSVLCRVIGHQPDENRLITDAGALALSKDRGTSSQEIDYGFGAVCTSATGVPVADYYVASVNQEHGIVKRRVGRIDFFKFPLGSLLRILPNHACLTAACHSEYLVVDGSESVVACWQRINGW